MNQEKVSSSKQGKEIKFRAWCYADEENRMVYFDLPEHNDNGLWLAAKAVHIDEYLSPLMQLTGRQDKNGKDIYESDILFDPSKQYGGNKVVVWNEAEAKFELNNMFGHSLTQSKILEIVGNLYEHPHLLNPSK